MKLLYNIGICTYAGLIKIASSFNPKAKLFYKGRIGILDKIRESITSDAPIIWFHCSSVGEFEQARPIIEWYRAENPQYKILLTFFSPSGYELYKNYALADWVFYLPLDKRRNVKEFLDIVKPSKAIFVKYEFWFNYLTELKKRNIPTYIISAIFRPSQYFFKWYGSFFRQMLNCYSLLFVQDKQSVELLNGIGIKDNVVLSGDTRFDRVNKIASTSKDFPQIEKFTNDKFSIVAGSTWMPDNELLASVVKNFSKIKLIIVPHEISEEGTTKIKTLFNDSNVIVMSELDDTTPLDVYVKADVLIIDKYGLLSSVYKYASMAYIGGGFGTGIHNTLEAATYSIPVVFGPNYLKFKEARDLIALGGARSVSDKTHLYNIVNKFVIVPKESKIQGAICGAYVKDNLGSTNKIISLLEKS